MDEQKILIVDDEKEMVDALFSRLENLGYKSIAAYDGREAIEKIKKENPDLILLDIVMPEPDGLGVLSWTRSQLASRETPVIILSAKNETETMSKVDQIESTEYLVKPVKLKEVEELIRKCLPRS